MADPLGDFLGDAPVEHELRVNHKYARQFDAQKRQQRIDRLQGDLQDLEEESSSSSVEEDEVGELISGDVSRRFLDVLSKIREKHPSVYDPSAKFFEGEASERFGEFAKPRPKEKSVTASEAQLRYLQTTGEEEEREERMHPEGMSYVQEQAALKRALKDAAGFEHAEPDDDLLVAKQRSAGEEARFEVQYSQFLREQKAKAPVQPWRKEGEEDAEESFLRNYIMTNGWIDESNPLNDVKLSEQELQMEEEDERALDRADRFEAEYNFRFEENPQLVSYPRDVPSLRREKEGGRKAKRKRDKKRRAREKLKKEEELKRLKAEKRSEISKRMRETASEQELQGAVEGLTDEQLEAYMGEFFGAEYEELAANRDNEERASYRYVEVPADDFGFDIMDILEAEDGELNEVVPPSAFAPYQTDRFYTDTRKVHGLKTKLRKRREERERMEEEELAREEKPKRKRRKKKKKA